MELPQVTRVYQNHHLDSTRWDLFKPRDDDVIITTAYKSGTTWAQHIFYQLLYGDMDSPPPEDKIYVWPDADFFGISRDDLYAWLEGFTTRRVVKSHLPLDGLPYFSQNKYIIVCRDPRDVFMSFFNHYSSYTDEFYSMMNNPEVLTGEPLPVCPEDPREL